MNIRDNLYKKAKQSGLGEHWIEAKAARNAVNSAIFKSKRDYIKTIVNRNRKDHRKLWKNINNFLPKK